MNLVMIHGRSQEGKDPVVLQAQWESAFERGLDACGLHRPPDLSVSFPFYGDRLDELVRQVGAQLVTDAVDRGSPRDTDEPSFRGELLREIADSYGISDEDIQAFYEGEPQDRGVLNLEWVQAILKALDATPLGAAVLDAFTRDVYVYLTYRPVREAVDAIVSEHLVGGPCVVVGHSLGSVVGYNVLTSAPAATSVRRYITVGCPLGLKSVKRKLARPLAMPRCAADWFNAMDERDVVALHPLDGTHFPIDPSIANKTDVRNHTENRHGIAGYLDDPDVARAIHSALSG